MIGRVLVVCEGNVCRSPLACALLAQALPDIEFSSAGTHAVAGALADPRVLDMARERSLQLAADMAAHVAQPLTGERVRAADLILTMTKAQRVCIETAWPFARGKVFRLGEKQRDDVVDPYGRHRVAFELAFAQIEHGVAYWRGVLAGRAH